MAILEWLEALSLSRGAGVVVPAGIFAISVAFFGFVIFNLHRSMSVRNVLGIDLSPLRRSGRIWLIVLYGVSYAVIYGAVFPFLSYIWFWVLVAMLTFLYNSKEPQELLLIGMAVLTAVRVTAYYNEDLSRDISKILPYGLLGIFLVNWGQFDLYTSLDLLERTGAEEDIAFYYWVYVSSQELILRVTQPGVIAVYKFLKTTVASRWRRIADHVQATREEIIVELASIDGPQEAVDADADGGTEERPLSSHRYHLTRTGISAAADALGFDAPSDFVRAYPVSRQWLALLIRRMDAVASVYRLAATMSPGVTGGKPRWNSTAGAASTR